NVRGFVIMVVIIGSLVVLAGLYALLPRDTNTPDNQGNPVAALATASAEDGNSGTQGSAEGAETADAATVATLAPEQSSVAENVPLPTVAQPNLMSPIGPLGFVQEYYGETYTFGNVTVAWRPGAFDPSLAQNIAAMAEHGTAKVNAFLGTDDTSPLTVYLADQMFNDDCRGCQGFAASDLHQIFILQDGSVAMDEMQGLITHEIAHVIAGNHIALPNSLFFAEGFATYLMDDDVQASGYITSIQSAAWAYQAGVLPTLEFLRDDATYEGRVRRRLEYDAAGSFSRFVVDTYGVEAYSELYRTRVPEQVLGVDWQQLEEAWHAYLQPYATAVVDGVDGPTWWNVAQNVALGFGALYDNPESVSVEDYGALTVARLALYRLDLPTAIRYANESNLAPKTAT
ncbi:MAG: hypothetical protein M9890_06250, partial [Thermomicrobiales bacterium]|nr:hypothetical protein [Thermomicrobiales bacterium]